MHIVQVDLGPSLENEKGTYLVDCNVKPEALAAHAREDVSGTF